MIAGLHIGSKVGADLRAARPLPRIFAARPEVGPYRRSHRSGFTLIELIFVMVLLIIVASMVAPRMSSFFRGRALSAEAQRLLSLTHYAQSRAVTEGVPVLLWIDVAKSTYGLEVQTGHEGDDDRGTDYT